MNTVLSHCLGSADVPESNIVRTIMEFLSFLHRKGMRVPSKMVSWAAAIPGTGRRSAKGNTHYPMP